MKSFFRKTNFKVEPAPVSHVDDLSFATRDDQEMANLGKIQQLRRSFGFWSILALVCTITVTWEAMLTVFTFGLLNGGPAGLIYSYLFCWIGYLSIVLSMAELTSMAPTTGGQYHWCFLLAPPSWRNLLSYITGWQTVLAWQVALASITFLAGTAIQGLVVLNHPSYVYERWHGTFLVYAILAIDIFFNTGLARQLPLVENVLLLLHVLGFFAVLVPLVVLAPHHSSAHDVFAVFQNSGGYSTQGLSFFVGMITSVYAFLGADGAIHMCEEATNASTSIPNGLVASIGLNGVMGFAMLIAVLFCIGNVEEALETPTGFPAIEIFRQATGSNGGGTGLMIVVILFFIFATISCQTAASRMLWAFARDRGLPGSALLSKVDPRTKLPLVAIFVTSLVTVLLGLINIGSTQAFNALISLVVAASLGSYLLPIGLLLWKRVRGDDIPFGPWQLGRFGFIANVFGMVWTIIAMFFSFWPTSVHPTPQNMNWASLLYGATMIFSVAFYALYGRFRYSGPVIEVAVVEQLHGA